MNLLLSATSKFNIGDMIAQLFFFFILVSIVVLIVSFIVRAGFVFNDQRFFIWILNGRIICFGGWFFIIRCFIS